MSNVKELDNPNFFEFVLKIRPEWDNGKVVPVEDENGEVEKYELKFETEADERVIKIQQPFKPATFGMILRNMTKGIPEESAILAISQYMWAQTPEDKELQKRILEDGRLLFSCLEAMTPLFDLCETELKKN